MGKFLKIKLLLAISIAGLSFFVYQGTARAADPPRPQNTIPSAGDFEQGSSVSLITAIYGNGYVLRAPTSTVRLYTPNRDNVLNIINGGNCPGQGGDVGPNNSETTTTYFISAVRPEALNGYDNTPYGSNLEQVAIVTNSQIKCDPVHSVSFTVPPDINRVGVGPASGQYAFEITAAMADTGIPGWNQFKYQVAAGGGRLSYYAGAGDHFAIKAVDGATPNPGDYKLGFAPGCGLKEGQSEDVQLKWFDEDAGQSNQGNVSPVQTYIREYDENNVYTGYRVPIVPGSLDGAVNGGYTGPAGPEGPGSQKINIISGDDVGGSVKITIRGHHKYEWVQYKIYSANGIQFQLPKDSYNTLINFNTDCPQPYSFSCSVSPGDQAGLAPNQDVPVTVNVTNTGDSGWDPSDTPRIQLQRKLSTGLITYTTVPRSVAANGGTIVFNFTEKSPTSAGTKTITYQMWRSGVGKMAGPSCQIKLTTGAGPPPATPSIAANCSTTTVTVPAASILATWHPPPNTHTGLAPYPKITKVPVQIVVTDSSDGSSLGSPTAVVDISGGGNGVYTTSTFGLAGNMWPHKNYDIHLIVKGTQAEDSATYNNDGNWSATYTAVDFNTEQGIGDCLHLTCAPTSSPDVEPGQSTTLSGGVNYINDTQQSYSTNPTGGYYFHINTSGGIVGAPGDASGGAIGTGSGTSNVSFGARIDYTGSYSISFMFQGSPLDLGQDDPCPDQSITPATRPYLQVWGGDINTGGGFETANASGAFSCSNSYPGYVSPAITGDTNSGGIKAFGASDGTYGSLSDFGALSLGIIAKNDSAHINFGAQPSFSNSVSPEGQLNSSPPSYCITDFYDKTQESPTSIGAPGSLAALGSQQYIVSGSIDNFGGGTVAAGQKTVLYVSGDVTITGNITYANWSLDSPDSAPSFALIVKGNINIAPNVTRLDGLYIAQPTSPGNDGQFNTCADNNGNQFCNQQLVANGAVIARVIMPLRSVGTLSPDANPGFAPPPGHVPAEVFNFIPSMVISTPNFAPVQNSLQGLFSLPPVF